MMDTAHPTIQLLDKKAVAETLGVSVVTIGRWVRAGRFPKPVFVTDSAPARWRLRDVEAWLDRKQRTRRTRKHSGWENIIGDMMVSNVYQFNYRYARMEGIG